MIQDDSNYYFTVVNFLRTQSSIQKKELKYIFKFLIFNNYL